MTICTAAGYVFVTVATYMFQFVGQLNFFQNFPNFSFGG